MCTTDRICTAMVDYEKGCPKRIQHFLKVHAFAALIGRLEGLDPDTQFTLEAAALVHDIGIKPALERYGKSSGPYQEELGPAPARALLSDCGVEAATVERVAFLVAHHHTYTAIDGMDYQILVEADFLVNLFEGQREIEAIRRTYESIFKTQAGRGLCAAMFGLDS